MKSGWEEAVCGESVAYARSIRALSAGVVADAVNTTAAFRLFAKCGVQRLFELHRKERTALRLDLAPFADTAGVSVSGAHRAATERWGIPGLGVASECGGYDRSKAADVTWGCVVDMYTFIISRDITESRKMP